MQVNFLPQPLPTYLAEEQCDEHTSADEHPLAYSPRASSLRQHPASPRPEQRCDEQKQKKAAQQQKVARVKTAAQGGATPEAPAAGGALDMAQPRANSEHQVLSLLALLVQKCKYCQIWRSLANSRAQFACFTSLVQKRGKC
jgi:hypothetical protein